MSICSDRRSRRIRRHVPSNYVLLNRRFENVGEFGYAYNPASTTASKTLDFASATSHDRAMLDFFTYNTASPRAGIVNLNTRNGPVLASIIKGAWLHDPGAEIPPPDPTYLVSQNDALAAAQAIVQETTSTTAGRGPALTRADVARLAAAAASALPGSRSLGGRNKADDRARVGGDGSSANLEPDDRRNRANGQYTLQGHQILPTRQSSSSRARNGIGSISRLIATTELCSGLSLRK